MPLSAMHLTQKVARKGPQLLGRFEGTIHAKGRVYIADGSTCKATLTAKEIAVEGHVEGNVEAGDRVELKPTGKIMGDVVAARMTMADGAALDGHVRIGLDSQATAKKTGSATEVKPARASERATAKR